eukprot:15448445-Alexandrium_andersonii.AAC.1
MREKGKSSRIWLGQLARRRLTWCRIRSNLVRPTCRRPSRQQGVRALQVKRCPAPGIGRWGQMLRVSDH